MGDIIGQFIFLRRYNIMCAQAVHYTFRVSETVFHYPYHKYHFNAQAMLDKIYDANGNKLEISDHSGEIVSVMNCHRRDIKEIFI